MREKTKKGQVEILNGSKHVWLTCKRKVVSMYQKSDFLDVFRGNSIQSHILAPC